MPGIYKIGMTTRTPEERLKEANTSNTWKPPAPYFIEMSKQVNNPLKTEASLHKLLERFCTRIHPKREFFRLSLEDVRLFFNLIEGNLTINRQCRYSQEKEWDEENEKDTEEEEEINMEEFCIDAAPVKASLTSSNIFSRFAYQK